MFQKVLSYFALPLLLFLSNSSGNSASSGHGVRSAPEGLNQGPDIITGDIADLEAYGYEGTQVGLPEATLR